MYEKNKKKKTFNWFSIVLSITQNFKFTAKMCICFHLYFYELKKDIVIINFIQDLIAVMLLIVDIGRCLNI